MLNSNSKAMSSLGQSFKVFMGYIFSHPVSGQTEESLVIHPFISEHIFSVTLAANIFVFWGGMGSVLTSQFL